MTARAKNTESAENTVEQATRETQEYVSKGFEKTLSTMKDGMENASKGFETSQEKMKENFAKAMKTTEDMIAFGQGNVEAFVKASQIFASGVQDLQKQVAATTQATVEESVATAKALSGVKSVKDVVDLQTGFARSQMERTMAETSKFTDASLKLTEQAVAPLTARFSLAVEKFSGAF